MPIKQKKSSRDIGQPNERPRWDDRSGAEPGESADARIRRMSMQMASAERSGFRGERTDLYGGLTPVVAWAIRIGMAAIVITGLIALTSLFRDKKTPAIESTTEEKDAIAALIRAAGETPGEKNLAESEEPAKDAFTWIRTTEESFTPFQETILSFLDASTPSERMAFVIPTPDTEKRLNDFNDDALFDQLFAPTFAHNYCSGEGWVTVDVLLPAFGFRPVLIQTTSGENKIDLDAFLGYNPNSSSEIIQDLKDGRQATFRTLVALAPNAPDSLGDIPVVLREPNDTLLLSEPINALLSKFGAAPEYILDWIGHGQPLPFTVTVTPETSLTGDSLLRISDIRADAWSSGLTTTPVTLAPPTEIAE